MFRKAQLTDVSEIMQIIREIQKQFKINKIDQWQNNYPNQEVIENDIKNNEGYVLLVNKQIVAYVYLSFNKEETYDVIYDGQWLSNDKYAVIHRLAIDPNFQNRGLASKILLNLFDIALENQVYSIKVDTHQDNLKMQKLLEKFNFVKCGIIHLKDQALRIAYEKTLEN